MRRINIAKEGNCKNNGKMLGEIYSETKQIAIFPLFFMIMIKGMAKRDGQSGSYFGFFYVKNSFSRQLIKLVETV